MDQQLFLLFYTFFASNLLLYWDELMKQLWPYLTTVGRTVYKIHLQRNNNNNKLLLNAELLSLVDFVCFSLSGSAWVCMHSVFRMCLHVFSTNTCVSRSIVLTVLSRSSEQCLLFVQIIWLIARPTHVLSNNTHKHNRCSTQALCIHWIRFSKLVAHVLLPKEKERKQKNEKKTTNKSSVSSHCCCFASNVQIYDLHRYFFCVLFIFIYLFIWNL